MRVSRRQFVATALAGGALTSLGLNTAMAQSARPDWQVGFANAPAGGFKPSVMQRIAGRLPAGFDGVLYRNGPAQFTYGDQTASHWFDGDGMIQRIAFEGGAAVHSGQFIDTPKRRAEQAAGRFVAPGFGTAGDPDYPVTSADDVNAANTSVLHNGGKLYALWEAGSAWEIDPETLASIGPKTWRPDLKGMPFLAHPKVEPDGRVWNLAVSGPNVGIYRIGADGALEDFGLVRMSSAAYVHDWAVTERHLVIMVQPWVYTRSIPPFVDGLEWRPEDGLRLMIVAKDDLSNVRHVQAPPRAFFHTGSAFEEADGTIRIDAALYAEPTLGSGGGADLIRGEYAAEEDMVADFCQIVARPGRDAELVSAGIGGEFPQVDPRRSGLGRDLAILTSGQAPGRPGATALSLVDWKSSAVETYDFGAGHMVEEFLIIPKPGKSDERDAWAVGTTINLARQSSEVHIFDLASVSDGPVASFRAGHAWPLGFHGTFVA